MTGPTLRKNCFDMQANMYFPLKVSLTSTLYSEGPYDSTYLVYTFDYSLWKMLSNLQTIRSLSQIFSSQYDILTDQEWK